MPGSNISDKTSEEYKAAAPSAEENNGIVKEASPKSATASPGRSQDVQAKSEGEAPASAVKSSSISFTPLSSEKDETPQDETPLKTLAPTASVSPSVNTDPNTSAESSGNSAANFSATSAPASTASPPTKAVLAAAPANSDSTQHPSASSSPAVRPALSAIPATTISTSPSVSTTGGPTICQNCQTSTTPLWRRDESGQILCNACGLFLKLHGRPRPISLKTDIIKSRNRARNSSASNSNHPSQQAKRKISQSPIPITNVMMQPVDHLSMSLNDGPIGSNNMMQRIQPHHAPSTPSTIFSYKNRGPPNTFGNNGGNTTTAPVPNQPPYQTGHAILYPNSGNPQLSQQQQQQQQQPPLSDHHRPDNSGNNNNRPLMPVASAAGTPNFSATTPQFPSSHHELPKLPALSSLTNNAGSNQDALPSIPPSLASEIHGSPQILTPQSRPQSPSYSNNQPGAGAQGLSNGYKAHESSVRLSAKGEAMSEQLRPRLTDDDKIPPLRHERYPRSHFYDNQAISSLSASTAAGTQNGGINRPRIHPAHQPLLGDINLMDNETLKTRVSELELVNDLLRSRVTQLEYSENNIRESELMLRKKLNEVEEKNKKLLRKLRNIFAEERKDSEDDDDDDYNTRKRLKLGNL